MLNNKPGQRLNSGHLHEAMSYPEQRIDSFVSHAWIQRLIVVALLTFSFGLMVSSAVRKSSTVDEQTHLFRGTAFLLEGATQFRDVHPPMGFVPNALLLLTEPDLRLPVDLPAWEEGRWEIAADAFLWQQNLDPLRIIFLGRLASMWLALVLGVLVFRWAKQLGGIWVALVAMTLILFDPNILAHARLITNDISVTLLGTLAIYLYWRWSVHSRMSDVVALGFALGLAGATKFNSIIIVLTLVLIAGWLALKRQTWRPVGVLLFAGIISIIVLWAAYRFQVRPFPLASLWADIQWTVEYLQQPFGAYLFGEAKTGGWWYYFPVAFLLKTPLSTLILLLWSMIIAIVCFKKREIASCFRENSFVFLVLFPVIYFGLSIFSPLKIGYRHLLPILPFLALFIAVALLSPRSPNAGLGKRIAILAAASLILISTIIWPDYLPYFNMMAGGSERDWRHLSDSNIDWGQDLPGLAEWNDARPDDMPLYFSYFGTAHPSAYGLEYNSLPTWPPGPEQLPPNRQTFDPLNPSPGYYALSVTNLHGQVLGDRSELYAAFREQEPVATIGKSIRIYKVPAVGDPFNLALVDLGPGEIENDLRDSFPGNDRQIRWLSDSNSLVWSPAGMWLVTRSAVPAPLEPYIDGQLVASDDGQSLYWLNQLPDIPWESNNESFGEYLTFRGSQLIEESPHQLTLLTSWEADSTTDRPLKIFVHALDDSGHILSQWDGMTIDPNSLRPGDQFIQLHELEMPESPVARLAIGVYDAETLERLTRGDGRDTIEVDPVP